MRTCISVLRVDGDRELPAASIADHSDSIAVERVRGVAQALGRLARGDVDCVLSGLDDPSFREAVRAVDSRVPLVVLTGATPDETSEVNVTDCVRVAADAAGPRLLADRIEDAVRARREQPARPDGGGAQRASSEALRQTPDGVFAVDGADTVRDANEAAVRMFGADSVVGRPIEDVVAAGGLDEEYLASHRDAVRQIRDGVGDVRFEFAVSRDGAVRTYEARYAPLSAGEEFTGVVVSARDVSALVDREPAFERYDPLLATIPDTVAVLDLEGRFLDLRNFEEWSGYTREELEGEHLSIAVPDEYVQKGEQIVRELLRDDGREKATYELEVETKDGERVPFENHITLLPPDEDGRVPGTLSILRDISDRKAHERQLDALHEATRELVRTDDVEEIADVVAETVPDFVEFVRATVALYDEDDDLLAPVETAADGRASVDLSSYERESVSWRAFESGEVRTGSHDSDSTRREIACPLGDHGVLVLESADSAGFEDLDVSIAEILAGGVETALDRIEHLRELEARARKLEAYDTAVESTRDSIAVMNSDTEVVMVNERFERTTNHDEKEIIGRPIAEVRNDDAIIEIPDDVDERWSEAFHEAIENGRGSSRYEMVMELDGEIATVESRITAVQQDDGSVVFVMVTRDVTERKEREEQIERLHESARELMAAESKDEVARDVVAAVENTLGFPANVVRLVDDAGERLEPAAVTESARDLLGERSAIAVDDHLMGEAFRSGEPRLLDDIQEHTDAYDDSDVRSVLSLPIGEYGMLSIVDEAVGAYDEADVRIAEILTSNAEAAFDRVEKEEALRERERALSRQIDRLDQFASIVSHDLRNPLNVAKGHLGFVEQQVEDGEHVDVVAESLDRMEAIIQDVLTLAREGDEATDLGPVDLRETVETCWGNVDTREATLDVEVDGTIMADESRLQQLFENLLRNGIDHVGDDVAIRVGDLDGGFYVEDDGPGIPEEDREQIFETGYSTSKEGTGFGLNIVKTIAEAHEWEVAVTEGSDGGARFEVTGVGFVD